MINSAYEELIKSYFVNDISVTYTLKTDDITVCCLIIPVIDAAVLLRAASR